MNKKKIAIITGMLAVIAGVLYFVVLKPTGSAAFTEIKTEKVQKQDISSTISASGVVEEVEKEDVYFETALKVEKILVEEDEKVTKGQKLIEFDMDSLHSDYEQLKLDREIQALNLKKIRETGNNQNIKSLELSVQQAEESLKTDKRNLEQAAKDYEKNKLLYENGVITKSEYEKYENAHKDALDKMQISSINYESAKNNLENAQKNNTIDVSSQEAQLKLKDIAIADMEKKMAQVAENSISPMLKMSGSAKR